VQTGPHVTPIPYRPLDALTALIDNNH
jgi:hypothetical protein